MGRLERGLARGTREREEKRKRRKTRGLERERMRRRRCYDDDSGTPPPWDLSPFTAVEIRSPMLLIYRYLDTYTLTGVVF